MGSPWVIVAREYVNPKQNDVINPLRWVYPPLKGSQMEEKTLQSFWDFRFFVENGSKWIDMGPFGLKMGRIDVESSQETS